MVTPTINVRATNVELTEDCQLLITHRLVPLARYLQYESSLTIDVVLRRVRSSFGGTMYYVSAKLTTPSDSYMAVATESHLPKALTKTRETLRRAISKGASVNEYGMRRLRQREMQADYTLALK